MGLVTSYTRVFPSILYTSADVIEYSTILFPAKGGIHLGRDGSFSREMETKVTIYESLVVLTYHLMDITRSKDSIHYSLITW